MSESRVRVTRNLWPVVELFTSRGRHPGGRLLGVSSWGNAPTELSLNGVRSAMRIGSHWLPGPWDPGIATCSLIKDETVVVGVCHRIAFTIAYIILARQSWTSCRAEASRGSAISRS